MEKNLSELLEKGVSSIDSTLCTDKVLSRLRRLYDEISLFNPSYGLVNAQGRDLQRKTPGLLIWVPDQDCRVLSLHLLWRLGT